jgi:GntR family transcriptional regulator
MKIRINRSIVVPLVDQIRDQVVAAISAGDLRPGDRLPPIRQLAQFLGINRNTVGQAYRLLEHEGYLVTRAGGGTTIAPSAPAAAQRGHALRDLIRRALTDAVAAGFTAQEFAELAYYEAAREPLHQASIAVVDEYQGELATFGAATRLALPDCNVREILLGELAGLDAAARRRRLAGFDFVLVPYYCLEEATAALASVDIPMLAAGLGPSLAVLDTIRREARGRRVAIVCTELKGPERMERALRGAGIELNSVLHVHADHQELSPVLAGIDLVIASEGSAAVARAAAGGKAVITYSALLNEASLSTVRSYLARAGRNRATADDTVRDAVTP